MTSHTLLAGLIKELLGLTLDARRRQVGELTLPRASSTTRGRLLRLPIAEPGADGLSSTKEAHSIKGRKRIPPES